MENFLAKSLLGMDKLAHASTPRLGGVLIKPGTLEALQTSSNQRTCSRRLTLGDRYHAIYWQDKHRLRVLNASPLGETSAYDQSIQFQRLPSICKKVIDMVSWIGDYNADQGWQAVNVYGILLVGLRVVLLSVFDHKHFTMCEANLFSYSTD